MTDFITVNNLSERSNGGKKNTVVKIAAAVFWIAVWQIVSMAVGYSILLPSPFEVVQKLIEILPRSEFVSDVAFSFVRIIGGFFCAAFAGTVFAVLSYNFVTVKILLMPLVSLVKTVPVASFVVIALIWLPSRNLSFLISFLMVLPIMYSNILSGLYAVDEKMLEMSRLFGFRKINVFLYIYLPPLFRYFRAACASGLGLCWKAGVAAELIGIPHGSLGENLYYAKVYFQTSELLAWTAIIVLASVLFEKLFVALLDAAYRAFERA